MALSHSDPAAQTQALPPGRASSSAARASVPAISAPLLRFFRSVVRRYFRRHFRAVMVQQAAHLSGLRGPLVVYANHSSWWDPMVMVLLGEELLPRHTHYAPIDASALARYPILRRLGMFAVEMTTARGAAQFLRTSQAILQPQADAAVWITPQGRFADARQPLVFKPGLGALAARVPGLTLVPLAIEYTFWDERLPETLLRLGPPLQLPPGTTAEAASQQLQAALAAEMAALRSAAIARDPAAFQLLLSGARGTGGWYGLGRRLRALFTGQPLRADHTERADSTEAQRPGA